MIRSGISLGLALAIITACTAATGDAPPLAHTPPPPVSPAPAPSYPGQTTRILSEADAQRLLHNKGITLQWIDWNTRGTAVVSPRDGLWTLRAAQAGVVCGRFCKIA